MTTKGARRSERITYQLLLPPEYHVGRSYPVLIVLHHAEEEGKDMIRRWEQLAARHGYILAAPTWARGSGATYGYTSEEHVAVLNTLRDLRRRVAVDSDRVFLSGFGEGGNMAYDIGLSHPDLFAGVLPISGQPRYHARRYWQNGQYLPFYIVWGERMGWPDESTSDGNKANTQMFREWIPAGYPMLGIQYKGRGREWFSGELPDAFDWMSRKTRANPRLALGRDSNGQSGGGEFRTQRSEDNRFYWLSTEEIAKGRLNDGPSSEWNWRRPEALLCGQISEGNQISVRAHGLRQVSVWLARGMIDFEKPVVLRINFAVMTGWSNRKVTPSLATLLEDYYQRGDRQRLYIARLDVRI
jgi:pimeloyl-ACP methyl ester carboxylesterase